MVIYWMPLEQHHDDPERHDSLIYDNRGLMEMRLHNLGNPLSPSMEHKIRSTRILSDLEINTANNRENDIIVTTSVIAVIYHRQQTYYAGEVTYRLKQTDSGIKIKTKRVDILNADAPLDIIMMYI